MNKAKIFTNGRSQAVRLPKDFRFNAKEVYINKIGDVVMLISKNTPWKNLINSLDKFSDDFMTERNQPENQKRELFK
ncbi:antitoxin [Candidatus Desantisbacteria bacterium]|nr:antitoxin [Candidatus Desantisbacteria bacterium]